MKRFIASPDARIFSRNGLYIAGLSSWLFIPGSCFLVLTS
jgi:hypothetical protein